MPIWGVDLGGTKIEAVVLECGQNPDVIVRKRIDTEAEQGYSHILGRIKLLLDQVSGETGLVPEIVGFGTPGALDPITKTMKSYKRGLKRGQVCY